jgi:hypothetical protein
LQSVRRGGTITNSFAQRHRKKSLFHHNREYKTILPLATPFFDTVRLQRYLRRQRRLCGGKHNFDIYAFIW